MLKVVDVEKELRELVFLEGRTKNTSAEEQSAAFATLALYRDGGVFAGGFSGESPWERHPGDELVHVLGGAAQLTVMAESGPEVFELRQGMVTVIPRGLWHRFQSDEGITVMTVTPQPTEHTQADDPRALEQ